MDSCDICGKGSEEMYYVIVEGAHMTVCEKCSRGNVIVGKVETQAQYKQKYYADSGMGNGDEVTENYGIVIRSAREKIGLTLEQFGLKINEKESSLRRVEEGKMLPTVELTAKLEKELGIKLTAPSEKPEGKVSISKDEPITLWDAAYKKESKNKGE